MNEDERRLIAQNTAALQAFNKSLSDANIISLRGLLAQGIEPPDAVEHLMALIPEAALLPGVSVPLGIPVSKLARKTTSETTYQDIVEWEITAGHTGQLFEISFGSDNYAKTQFRLVISDVEQWVDQYLPSALDQPFKDNRLLEKSKVVLQAKSSDATEITAYGAISGKLIPPAYRKVGYGV